MAIVRHEESCSLTSDGGAAKGHRFRGSGAFIEQRCVRDIERRQVGDHRLKIKERFETALRDLRLVRCVGRVPAGILEDIPLDDWRSDRVVIAGLGAVKS